MGTESEKENGLEMVEIMSNFNGDQFCLLQEEEKEGIQMTTTTKQ